MLKELSLEELGADVDDYNIEIDTFNCNDNEITNDEIEIIYKIILNNIGIQISLAEILLKYNHSCDGEEIISFVFLDEKRTAEEQLKELMHIFRYIHKVYNEQHELIAYEVYSPTKRATKAFIEAYNERYLNKWIKVFYSGTVSNDCNKISLYKYILEDNSGLNNLALKNDEFFKYILFKNKYGIIQSGVYISQYSLQHIENVPFIKEIAYMVDNLYIIVSQERSINGDVIYEKYLTWDKVREPNQCY